MGPYGGGNARRGRRRNGGCVLAAVSGLVLLHATMGDAQTGLPAQVVPIDVSVRGRVCDAVRSVQTRLGAFPQVAGIVAALLQSFGCSGPPTPGSSTTSTSLGPTTSTALPGITTTSGSSPPTTSATLPPCLGTPQTTTVPCQPTTSSSFLPPTISTTLGPGQTTTSTTVGFCTTTTSGGGPQTTTTTAPLPPTTIPCIPRP